MTTAPHIRDLAALLAKPAPSKLAPPKPIPAPPSPAPLAPSKTTSEPLDPPRTKSPQRQAQGRASQAQGSALEEWIKSSGRRAGLYVVHVPTPGKVLARRGREVTSRLEAPVAPDFVGLLPGGRGFAMEAKTTSGAEKCWALPKRLRLPDAQHPKRGHQGQELLRVRALGGAAAVYLRSVTLGRDFLIPIGLEGSPDLAAPSWAWEDLARFRIPPSKGWWDLLA